MNADIANLPEQEQIEEPKKHTGARVSRVLTDYHVNNLREYKFFLHKFLTAERHQDKLRKLYEKAKPKSKKRKELKKKIKKRPQGHPRVNFDYETAKLVARSECIGSMVQYGRWWEMNRPQKMPKYPMRAYERDWKGWGDFLGVYNDFSREQGSFRTGKGKWRKFPEAKAFARSLGLNGQTEWFSYVKSGTCPIDIPHRPDVVYGNFKKRKKLDPNLEYWLSWKDFLGYRIQEAPTEKIDIIEPVLYIARKEGVPNNVYVVNVIPGGKAALIDHINKLQFKLICAYYTSSTFNRKNFLDTLTEYPYGGIDEFIINNVYEVMEVLEETLEKVR
jgi:hypothetical protein